MSDDIYEALARTALLIDIDVFPGVDHRRIIDGLRATTVRIIADRANTDSSAGQIAVATLFAQLAMLGVQIDLDMPSAPMLVPQPPLQGDDLASGLLDYAADLMPGGSLAIAATPDITFAIGDTLAPPGAVHIGGTAWGAETGTGPGRRWKGDRPAGAMAAGAAGAADGLRAAIPRIAAEVGRPCPADDRWMMIPERQVRLDLTRYRIDAPVALGAVDCISGGAITSAALYAILRMPGVAGVFRVIEPDILGLSNLNRYALARRSMVGWRKTHALRAIATDRVIITGEELLFDKSSAEQLAPLAPLSLVGVDHIPARWDVQRAYSDGLVCIGATSHDYALVSAHPPGSPCAGCSHPRDEPFDGEIPTVSFVSFWAGLLQALELAAHAAGASPPVAVGTHAWPLGLHNPRGIQPFSQAPVASCPVKCEASAQLRNAANRLPG